MAWEVHGLEVLQWAIGAGLPFDADAALGAARRKSLSQLQCLHEAGRQFHVGAAALQLMMALEALEARSVCGGDNLQLLVWANSAGCGFVVLVNLALKVDIYEWNRAELTAAHFEVVQRLHQPGTAPPTLPRELWPRFEKMLAEAGDCERLQWLYNFRGLPSQLDELRACDDAAFMVIWRARQGKGKVGTYCCSLLGAGQRVLVSSQQPGLQGSTRLAAIRKKRRVSVQLLQAANMPRFAVRAVVEASERGQFSGA